MARPRKYFKPMKDFHIYLEQEFVAKAEERAKSLNLSFVAYLQKLMADDIVVWEYEQRQNLLKTLNGEN